MLFDHELLNKKTRCTTFLLLLLNLPKYHGRRSPHICLGLMSDALLPSIVMSNYPFQGFVECVFARISHLISPKVRILLEKYQKKTREDGFIQLE